MHKGEIYGLCSNIRDYKFGFRSNIYIYNDVHNGIMMLEILQILVSQIKKKSNIHLLCSLGPPITFICTSICVFYVVKFVELLPFFKIM